MKNLIINIFKTLFFFDLAVIIFSLLPVVENKNPALALLINESIILGVVLLLTFIFIIFLEKRQLVLPVKKKFFPSLLKGLGVGSALPVICVAVMFITKSFHYVGFNKVDSWYFWIAALLVNAISTELLFRGYLFKLYNKFYGFTFATVATTLMFLSLNVKLFEENKYYVATVILFNVLLCFILEYTNSVVVTIATRFTYTLLSCFLLGSYPLIENLPKLINYTITQKKYVTGEGVLLENSVLMLVLVSVITLLFFFKKYRPITQIKRFIRFMRDLPKIIKLWKERKKHQIKKFRITRKTKKIKVKK